jgi:anti-sigma B factor antagonist
MQDVVTVIHLVGAFRAPTNNDLERKVRGLLDRGDRRIILNLAAVSDLDAAGLGELVRVATLAADAGGLVRIVGATGWTRTFLDRAGLLTVLDWDSDAPASVGLLEFRCEVAPQETLLDGRAVPPRNEHHPCSE